MRRPEISIELTPPGTEPKPVVYANGIVLQGVKAVVAYPGADVILVLDPDAVRIDPRLNAGGSDLVFKARGA